MGLFYHFQISNLNRSCKLFNIPYVLQSIYLKNSMWEESGPVWFRGVSVFITQFSKLITQGLFGLGLFWVISLETHNSVMKKRGTHTNFVVWLNFHIVFPSLKTQQFWVRVMETENKKSVFSKTKIGNSVALL